MENNEEQISKRHAPYQATYFTRVFVGFERN
jgi:hypothetical protein